MKRLGKLLLYGLCSLAVVAAGALLWLRWDAGRSLEPWFEKRHGQISEVQVLEAEETGTQLSQLMRLKADSGLNVTFRMMRSNDPGPLPILLVLGGHRTGSDAARLFGAVGNRAIIALDYPYDGPQKVKGLVAIARTLPLARQAFRDTPPAIELTLDWLLKQTWVDSAQIIVVGASLGVPFAAHAAANDSRIRGAILVHGAADNQAWLERQVARRTESRMLHAPVATLIHWLAYGPTFATGRNVAAISPRPVLIVGARNDERTPAGQTELLFASAREPKWLRWTEGAHIQPGRTQIVADVLTIADDMLPFPTTQ